MSEAFYLHLFPGRVRVLGRKLPPLSLWHLAALEAIGSPFVCGRGSDRIDLGDIQAAVKICRARWPNTPQTSPSLWDVWTSYRFRESGRKVRIEAEKMMAHIARHLASPELWQSEDGSNRIITAPHILSRVAGLVKLGIDYNRIWNDITPGFASWLLLAMAERDGADVRFVQPGDDAPVLPIQPFETEKELRAMAAQDGLKGPALNRAIKRWKEARKHG